MFSNQPMDTTVDTTNGTHEQIMVRLRYQILLRQIDLGAASGLGWGKIDR